MPVLLVLLVGSVYLNSLPGDYVYDDITEVEANSALNSLLPPWTSARGLPVRYLPYFTFAIDRAVYGDWKPGYHITNVLIHLSSVLLLFGIVRRTLCTPSLFQQWSSRAAEIAFFVALIWGVHPLLTQAVTYTYQRMESLMGMCFLLTLYAFIRSVASPIPMKSWQLLTFIASCAGMASKEVMIAAPLLVLWYDVVFIAGSWREVRHKRAILHCLLFSSWVVLWFCFRLESARYLEFHELDLQEKKVTSWHYLCTQAEVIVEYLRLSLWPNSLCLDYLWPVAPGLASVWPQALLVLALVGLTIWAVFRCPAWGFVGGWFFLILAPTSSISPVAARCAEHRMYLPLISLVVLVVFLVQSLRLRLLERGNPSATWLLRGGLVAIAVALGVVTVNRNPTYYSRLTMAEDVVAKRPQNVIFQHNLCVTCMRKHQWKKAEVHARQALLVLPDSTPIRSNLGRVLYQQGKQKEGLQELELALKQNPRDLAANCNLATVLMKQDPERAKNLLLTALSLNPNCVEALNDLGVIIIRSDPEGARKLFLRAIAFDRRCVQALINLGNLEVRSNRPEQGLNLYQQALQIDPQNKVAAQNYKNITEFLRKQQSTKN